MTTRITIKDVAREAGVAPGTVSAVLNRNEGVIRVSATTREKIFETARRLHYTPNPSARALRTGRSNLIGIISRSTTVSFIPEIIAGVSARLLRYGYTPLLANYQNAKELVEKIHFLQNKQIDGVLILPEPAPEIQALYPEIARLFPAVTVGGSETFPEMPFVKADGAEMARIGMEHLLQLGHRRIALFLGSCRERLDGYRAALNAAGVPFDPALVIDPVPDFDAAAAAVARLNELPQPVTAILAQSDIEAAGALYGAHTAGIRVPEALSVVGVDDLPLARMVYPQLTSVAQPKREHGELAAEVLLKLMATPAEPEKLSVRLKPHLIVRGSSAPRPCP